MQDLIKQEQFEIEVLDLLHTKRFLPRLIFCGRTMPQLCYGLSRFSVDLDFWLAKRINITNLFKSLKKYLSESYRITNAAIKFHTILFEIKSGKFPGSLKIKIHKESKKFKIEREIAFSRFTTLKVPVNVVSLEDMMSANVKTFISRKEKRDVFDIEFFNKAREWFS
ncbi:MAG: nucleotidyl transferase AbiEii/AbiGii toxin family protein [candidate division WOR-3 bacterium]|nr:nucleotidyl transferase AbiEii/AbiGii toxin family protein [candidate division WOR-3 bacterium]